MAADDASDVEDKLNMTIQALRAICNEQGFRAGPLGTRMLLDPQSIAAAALALLEAWPEDPTPDWPAGEPPRAPISEAGNTNTSTDPAE